MCRRRGKWKSVALDREQKYRNIEINGLSKSCSMDSSREIVVVWLIRDRKNQRREEKCVYVCVEGKASKRAENTRERKGQKERSERETEKKSREIEIQELTKAKKKEGKGCTSKESGETLNSLCLPVGLIGCGSLVPCCGSLISSGGSLVSSGGGGVSCSGSWVACCRGISRSRLVSRSRRLVCCCGDCCRWISCCRSLKRPSCSLVCVCSRVSCGRCLISSCGCLITCGGRRVSCGLVSCGGLVILGASLVTGT